MESQNIDRYNPALTAFKLREATMCKSNFIKKWTF